MKANSKSHLFFLASVSGFLVSSFSIFGTFQGETQLSLFANFQVEILLEEKTCRHLYQSAMATVMMHDSIHIHGIQQWAFISHTTSGGGGVAHLKGAWWGQIPAVAPIHGSPFSSWYLQAGRALLVEMTQVKGASRTIQGLFLPGLRTEHRCHHCLVPLTKANPSAKLQVRGQGNLFYFVYGKNYGIQ